MKKVVIAVLVISTFCISISKAVSTDKEWIAPTTANAIVNPIKGNPTSTQEGKKLFTQMCVPCHGDKGKGDGIAGAALNPKPANYTLPKVQNQSDGALFWKITNGRGAMVSFKVALTDEQRWQLVNYIRVLGKGGKN